MKISIVRDGRSHYEDPAEAKEADQHAESVAQAVKQVLDKKYDTEILIFDDDLLRNLRKNGTDLVFNLANGRGGENSMIQVPSLLEYGEIPYTASGPLGHGICYNKIYTSKILSQNNVRTPKFFAVHELSDIDGMTFEYPLIVKPKDEGSSRGVHNDSFVEDRQELEEMLTELLEEYRPPIMINEFLDGRELTVGVVGNPPNTEVLPILEIDFSDLPKGVPKIYSFEVKYQWEERTKYYIPARLTDAQRKETEAMAKKAFRVLDLKDYARIDFRLKDGKPYIIEINSLPGLNPEYSDIVKMTEAMDKTYDDLIFKIVDLAKERWNLTV